MSTNQRLVLYFVNQSESSITCGKLYSEKPVLVASTAAESLERIHLSIWVSGAWRGWSRPWPGGNILSSSWVRLLILWYHLHTRYIENQYEFKGQWRTDDCIQCFYLLRAGWVKWPGCDVRRLKTDESVEEADDPDKNDDDWRTVLSWARPALEFRSAADGTGE